jgi:hypothetical protein
MNDDTSGWSEINGSFFTSSTDSIPYLNTGSNNVFSFTASTTTTGGNGFWSVTLSEKDWMPYKYVEYEPKWHQKFARYKLQMQNMWD